MERIVSSDYLQKAEEAADKVLRHLKHILPTLARFCLVSTFIEDGIRMISQWGDQRDYMDKSWGIGYFLGTMFVLINLLGQLIGSVMILIRFRVPIGVYLLFFIICFQTLAYGVFYDLSFLIRSLSLCGALLLLLAESKSEARSLFAGVPQLNQNNPKAYMQFFGRLMVAIMFITVIRFDFSFLLFLQMLIASVLMLLVIFGYKTKLSALALVIWLTALNFYFNAWWTIDSSKPMRDYYKYDFFQTLSVVGGLLMIVYLGPGGVSLDDYKKRW